MKKKTRAPLSRKNDIEHEIRRCEPTKYTHRTMHALRASALCLGIAAAFDAGAVLSEVDEAALRKAMEVERLNAQNIQLIWHHLPQLQASEIGEVVATVFSEWENRAPDLPSLGASTMWLNGEAVSVNVNARGAIAAAATGASDNAAAPSLSNISVEPPAPPTSFAADAEADNAPRRRPGRFYWDAFVVRGKGIIQVAQAEAETPIEAPAQEPTHESEGLMRGRAPTPTAAEITSPPIETPPRASTREPERAAPPTVAEPALAKNAEKDFDIRELPARQEPPPWTLVNVETPEKIARGGNRPSIPVDTDGMIGPDRDPFSGKPPRSNAIDDLISPPPGAVAAVPEPSTYAFMAGGLGLMGFYLRRKRAKGASSKNAELTEASPPQT